MFYNSVITFVDEDSSPEAEFNIVAKSNRLKAMLPPLVEKVVQHSVGFVGGLALPARAILIPQKILRPYGTQLLSRGLAHRPEQSYPPFFYRQTTHKRFAHSKHM